MLSSFVGLLLTWSLLAQVPADTTFKSATDTTLKASSDTTFKVATDSTIKASSSTAFMSTTDTTIKAPSDTTLKTSVDSALVSALDSTLVSMADSTLISPLDSTLISPLDSTISSVMDSTAVSSDSLSSAPKLSEKERKRMVRDSIKAVKDSIRRATPRILNTCALPDSLYYKKIIAWNTNTYFNKLNRVKVDTTYNDWHTEYPFFKEDINATYLGVVGSATQNFDYFKRRELDIAPFYAPYLTYTYTPETIPMYNTKTPHTVLAYWGTLFDYQDKEESSMKFLHTQNISPKLNLQMEYHNYGGKGLLVNEATNNRTFTLTANYLGENYVANGGFINNSVRRKENGGVYNTKEVTDTTLDAKTIMTNLSSASNKYTKRSFFLSHSYGVPIRFKKDLDSLGRDSIAAGEGTMAYFGHYAEYSIYSKFYSDRIGNGDTRGKDFYHDKFYINPTTSADSLRVTDFTNRVYAILQPWASDAIVSKIEGGVGFQFLNYFSFGPNSYIDRNSNINLSNTYVYGSVNGKFRKYFSWEGFGRYTLLGYNSNDMEIDIHGTFSFYPFKNRGEGIDLVGRFYTSLKRPDYYSNHLYSNHYVWDNNFKKVSKSKIEGYLKIPKWKMEAHFGYALIGNNIYYDTLGVIRQNENITNVISGYLQKDFKLGILHLDNKALLQFSSDNKTLPLPLLALNLRYYIEFDVVKNAMRAQLGAETTFTTSYYAPAYSPALGQFHNQNRELVGNTPYIDIFANIQWKTASIFLKCTNMAEGWPSGDYFSAYQYIKPKRTFKVGIFWPFFVK